jgi:anaerobic selenocysteine-containing dehydrogenase
MVVRHARTCPFCEATCGVVVSVEEGRLTQVRGDPDDPFSRGYLCAKATALIDVHHDPDRLREPLRRTGGGWQSIGWDAAIEEAGARLAAVQERHGADSVALYQGNPTLHHYASMLAGLELARVLATRNLFSTASIDHQPHLFAAHQVLGNRALLPVPDIDRTDFLLLLGSNPLVSNGSMMTAPNMPERLERLRRRGGRLVVVDPRRTRTAAAADQHIAIPPGTDVLLLLAMLYTLFAEDLVRPGRLAAHVSGLAELQEATQDFPPERVAPRLGLEPGTIAALARSFAAAESAACHGRLGVSTQEYGGLCAWLILALNVVTGNLDREGGVMFPRPAVDLAALARLLGEAGSYDRWRSRVAGLPEIGGELPLATLADEIATPGRGQVRALVTVAGNPVLTAPGGARLDRLLPGLDFMLAVDFYMNETTRHADLILPPVFAFERDHFDLALHALAVRDVARYCEPLRPAGPDEREDWRILLDLAVATGRRKGRASRAATWRARLLRRVTPRRMLALLVRFGPHGAGLNPFGGGLTLARLRDAGRTVDLGPLRPGQLPRRLGRRGRIRLAPAPMLADLDRVRADLRQPAAAGFRLVGRREARSNNSWLHNAPRLAKGSTRCTLAMNGCDAARLGLLPGELAELRSAAGRIAVPVEIDAGMMPGVVSLPHGFGHDRAGTRLGVAARDPGVSVNDLSDPAALDPLTGTAAFNGQPVEVAPLFPASRAIEQADRILPCRTH